MPRVEPRARNRIVRAPARKHLQLIVQQAELIGRRERENHLLPSAARPSLQLQLLGAATDQRSACCQRRWLKPVSTLIDAICSEFEIKMYGILPRCIHCPFWKDQISTALLKPTARVDEQHQRSNAATERKTAANMFRAVKARISPEGANDAQ